MDQYEVLLADPPWQYVQKGVSGAAENHYSTLSFKEIRNYTLPKMSVDSAAFLWVPNAFLKEGLEVLDAWGYKYKTIITWVKPYLGLGFYLRNATEQLLFGTRGQVTRKVKEKNVLNWFIAERREHSRKPEHQYWIVERLFDGPYVELFSRHRRLGWDSFGDELDA